MHGQLRSPADWMDSRSPSTSCDREGQTSPVYQKRRQGQRTLDLWLKSINASKPTPEPNPPDSLCVAARLDHGEGLRATPVPEVQLIVGGNQEELSGRVKGQRGDGDVALREPALTPALEQQKHCHEDLMTVSSSRFSCFRAKHSRAGPRYELHHQGTRKPPSQVSWGERSHTRGFYGGPLKNVGTFQSSPPLCKCCG